MEIGETLKEANEFLSKGKYDQAIEYASGALLAAMNPDDVMNLRAVLISAHFNLEHFDQVCAIADEMGTIPIPSEHESVALMLALSCLGTLSLYSRARTVKILMNSAESVCRLHFDSESGFADLRGVANDIADCMYGRAITKVRTLSININHMPVIVENMTQNLLGEYLLSYSRVPIVQVSKEFGLEDREIIMRTERLILPNARLSGFRIDYRESQFHRNFRSNDERVANVHHNRQRLTRELVNELSLFAMRLTTGNGSWVVKEDVLS